MLISPRRLLSGEQNRSEGYEIPVHDAVMLTFRASNDVVLADGASVAAWIMLLVDTATGQVHAAEVQLVKGSVLTVGIAQADQDGSGDPRASYVVTKPCNAPVRVFFEDPAVVGVPNERRAADGLA